MSFEDSDVVRSAIHVEGFRDDEFDYQLIRALGVADYGGSTVGECLPPRQPRSPTAAPRAGRPSSAGWPSGSRTRGRACLERGHTGSAVATTCCGRRPTTGRPSTTPRERRPETTDGGAEPAVLRRCGCTPRSTGRIASRSPSKRADCPAIWPPAAVPVAHLPAGPGSSHIDRGRRVRLERRGALLPTWAPREPSGGGTCSSSTGPASPGCMRADPPMTFRPDYEAPLAAVVDTLVARPDVDPGRVALCGQSFGSYFAARAAAPTSGSGRWWSTRPSSTWAGTWRHGWGPICSAWRATSGPRT